MDYFRDIHHIEKLILIFKPRSCKRLYSDYFPSIAVETVENFILKSNV